MEPNNLAESAYGYDPLWQKRTRLGRDYMGGGGYHWWGPPPDAGTSYGSWWDEENHFGACAPLVGENTTLYSPHSGRTMAYEGPAHGDLAAAVRSYNGPMHMLPASESGHTCLTSCPIFDLSVPSIYNPFTGEDVTEEYRVMSSKKPQKSEATAAGKKMALMGPAAAVPNAVEVPDLKATGLPKMDPKKPVDNKSVDEGKGKLSKGTEDMAGKEKNVKHSSIKPVGNDEVKIPDVKANSQLAKAVDQMSDEELLDSVEAYLTQADDESSKIEIEIMPEEEKKDMSAPMSEPEMSDMAESNEPMPAMPPKAPMSMAPMSMGEPEMSVSPEMSEEEKKKKDEAEIPVLSPESPEAESMMPYASAALADRLKATAAAMRSGVQVDQKELKSLMAKAARILVGNRNLSDADTLKMVNEISTAMKSEETKSAARPARKNSSGVESQLDSLTKMVAALTTEVKALKGTKAPAKAEPEKSAPEMSEEKEVEKLMSDEKKDEASGVGYEVLQSLEVLEREGISEAAVKCHIYAEGGVNPFWNITVHGEPLARIYLQDQDRPEEIKAVFVSPQYGEAISKASAEVEGGLRKFLHDAHAHFFAMNVDQLDISKRAQASAKASADKILGEKLAGLTDHFLECMATAAIGFDRNFFPLDNALKDSFYQNLSSYGLPRDQSVRVIEASFAEGAADYFKALASKATELMEMEPVAFQQFRKSVLNAGTIMPAIEAGPDAGKVAEANAAVSLAQHLAQNNVGMQSIAQSSRTLTEKEQLRRDLGFGSDE